MIGFTQKVIRSHGLTPENYVDARAEAWEQAGELWHSRFLPTHFEPGATERYGYRKRTPSYLNRKRNRYGHNKPLVKTGDMRRRALRSKNMKADRKRGKGGVTIRVMGPHYQKLYQEELRAVTGGEESRMEQLIKQVLEDRLSRETRPVEVSG